MRVLFVTPYFPPEVGAAQTRIYELALRLQRSGHKISILTTFPNYPSGVVPKEWRGKFFWKGFDNGMTVYRIWSFATPNRGFLKRIASQLSFSFFSALAGLFISRSDAMVIESPPLFDGFAGVFLNAIRSVPYVFMVSDLWPESAVQMGVLRNKRLIWLAKQIELLFYRRAAAVLSLTAGIQEKIKAEPIEGSKVVLFRNSVDCEFFRPGLDGSSMRQEIGVNSTAFVVMYAGTFGLAHKLSTLLETAALFQSDGNQQVRFVLAGDGADSDALKHRADELKLENVVFLNSLPKTRMPELLNASDAIVVPLRNLEIFRGALPTKMFEAMACGKPLILGVAGEAERLVRDAGAGYCIPPEDPVSMHQAISQIMQHPANARQMGERGRQYVQRNFDRDARTQQLTEVLQAVIAEQPLAGMVASSPLETSTPLTHQLSSPCDQLANADQ